MTGWIWRPSTVRRRLSTGVRFRLKMMRTVFAAFTLSLSFSSWDLVRLVRVCSNLTAIVASLCCYDADVSSAHARAKPGMLWSDVRRKMSSIITFHKNGDRRLLCGHPVGIGNGSTFFCWSNLPFRFVRKFLMIFTRNIGHFLAIKADRMAGVHAVSKALFISIMAQTVVIFFSNPFSISLTREWSADSVDRFG